MTLSKSLQNVASKVMAKLGGNVTIQSVSLGSYNSATGAATETITTKTVKGILEDVKATELRKPSTVENRQIRSDDKKLTIAALDLSSAPSLQDKIIISNITYGIITIETIEQANVAIAYELILRG